jgi:hypothetical protein
MHWETWEVLTVISGAVLVTGSLILPQLSPGQRLGGLGGGVSSIGYGIWMAGQTSGIVFIGAAPFAAALLMLFALYHAFVVDPQRQRAIPSVPVGTPGARQCLKCGQAFPAGTPGPCPACQGTLAPGARQGGTVSGHTS